MLASVCGGDPGPLLRLIRNESINEYVCSQAIDALVIQCGWGERPRDAVIANLRDLVRTLRGGDPLNEIVLVRSPSRRASDADFQQRVTEIVRDLRAQTDAIDEIGRAHV